MDQDEFFQRIVGLTEQLLLLSQEQRTISDRLTALIERHDVRLDNHDEQIARLTRIEERLEAFIERQFKQEDNGRGA
jgi:regulator of replication initiation timing